MHTPSSVKELLYSLPVEVEFAGFVSNTLTLARSGWDLSMQQDLTGRYSDPILRLAMRHEGAKLYAISSEVHLHYAEMMGARSNAIEYAKFLANLRFSIQYVSSEIRFFSVSVGHRGVSFSSSFQAIDPYPQERVEESISDFKFFKVSNPTIKDIIVSPEQVPELLEMVLRAQGPMVDQIRMRERSRQNTQWARENMQDVKPAHSVQAQIITLAS